MDTPHEFSTFPNPNRGQFDVLVQLSETLPFFSGYIIRDGTLIAYRQEGRTIYKAPKEYVKAAIAAEEALSIARI